MAKVSSLFVSSFFNFLSSYNYTPSLISYYVL